MLRPMQRLNWLLFIQPKKKVRDDYRLISNSYAPSRWSSRLVETLDRSLAGIKRTSIARITNQTTNCSRWLLIHILLNGASRAVWSEGHWERLDDWNRLAEEMTPGYWYRTFRRLLSKRQVWENHGTWYYFDSSGYMLADRWRKHTDGNWYWSDNSGEHYRLEEKSLISGTISTKKVPRKTGWLKYKDTYTSDAKEGAMSIKCLLSSQRTEQAGTN